MQVGGIGAVLPFPTRWFPNAALTFTGSGATAVAGAAGTQRQGLASAAATNRFALPAGGIMPIPPGIWYVDPGKYSSVQLLDPVTGLWRTLKTTAGSRGPTLVNSDGSNYRLYNPLGNPVGALVTAVGSGYVQSTTTVTASAGGSTWAAIVGGAVASIAVGEDASGNAGGTNWTLPPIVVIDAPPAGGIPATAYATVSGGAVSAVTLVDQGAGYAGAPTVMLLPNPLDPNFGSITIPACPATLGGAGEVCAVTCTAPGTVQSSPPTLTISGAGSSATATAIMALTITALTVAGGTAGDPVFSAGGFVTTAPGAIVNPSISTGLFVPRQANMFESSATAVTIIDGGLFQVAPTVYAPAGTLGSPTMGSTDDLITMQLMPGT